MTLPKVKRKRFIKKDFISIAKKVNEIFIEEAKFLREKKENDTFHLSTKLHSNS